MPSADFYTIQRKEATAFIFSLLLLLIFKHIFYLGIVHDAQLYAADLFRTKGLAPQDLLSLNPQQNGSLFKQVFRPLLHLLSIDTLFYSGYLLFSLLNFILSLLLLRRLLHCNFYLTLLFNFIFNSITWEILSTTITQNEPFFTVRPVAFFLIQLALYLAIFPAANKKQVFLWWSAFCAMLSFSFHPITAVYFLPVYLLFLKKNLFSIVFGALCGLSPFLLQLLFSTPSCVTHSYLQGIFSHELIDLVVHKNQYLFPSTWNSLSITKLFSTFALLFTLSFLYRKTLFGKIAIITALLCGIPVVLNIIFDQFDVYNKFLVSVQPLRAFSILNLYLYLLLAIWVTDTTPGLPPPFLRAVTFFIFIVLRFCVPMEVTVLLIAAMVLWTTVPRMRIYNTGWNIATGFITILACNHIIPTFNRYGLPNHPVFFFLGIGLAATLFVFRNKEMHILSFAFIIVVPLQIMNNLQYARLFTFSKHSTAVVTALQPFVPAASTIVYLAGRNRPHLDLSRFRISSDRYRVYWNTTSDRAPACFSAAYSREYLRRETLVNHYGYADTSTVRLLHFLKKEHIDYVISVKERPLELVTKFNSTLLS
ncbi:MAG: hypothetical protein JW863_07720 [Chitinispirillaceae bacterium]|nr:hypothetical protein [Chitinispirillaceae bacterium]